VAVTTFSAGTTGFTPSTATSGAVTLGGTLATTNGGTGLTSFTANGVVYASSTSALTTGSALVFDGTNLGIGTTSPTGWGRTVSVSNTSTDSGFTFEGSTRKWGIGGGFTDGALRIYDFTAATERMRISATGDVGIGTSSPTDKLTVSGGSNGSARVNGSDNVFLKLSGGAANEKHVDFYHDNTLVFENFLDGSNNFIWRTRVGGLTDRMRLDSSGNLGLGVTPSAWTNSFGVIQGLGGWSISHNGVNSNSADFLSNAYRSGGANTYLYVASANATRYQQLAGAHAWYTAPSGTAGNAISFTQAMTLNAAGNLLLGSTTAPTGYARISLVGGEASGTGPNTGIQFTYNASTYGGGAITTVNAAGGGMSFYTFTGNVGSEVSYNERMQITAAGFTRPVAYADTVSALGNSGTATTIDLRNANVFTATLTGNCTFTLSNPIATGSSSFTLILTNDGTAGRTVAWAGGSFVFPGGASALSRTTTANAVDVWVFFTPNGGTTWYGNIAMKDMKA
jgi:hypothetical protein